MALLKLNAAFEYARNKLDHGVVMYGSGGYAGRQLMRNYVVPTNPNTTAQQASRSRFASISSAWSLLSTSVADAWNALGATVTFADALGRSYNPSGKALYQAVNTYRVLDGQAISSAIPDTTGASSWDSNSNVWSAGDDLLNVELNFDGGTRAGFLQLRITPPWAYTKANLQAKATNLRLPSATTTECIVPQGSSGTVVIALDTVKLLAAIPGWSYVAGLSDTDNFWFGIELVVLNTAYFPVATIFQRQIQGVYAA